MTYESQPTVPPSSTSRGEVFYRIRDKYNSGRGCLDSEEMGRERVLRAAQTIF